MFSSHLGTLGHLRCAAIPSPHLEGARISPTFSPAFNQRILGLLNGHVGERTSLRSSNFMWAYLLGTFPALSGFLLAGHRDPFLTFLDISSNSHLPLPFRGKQGKPPLPVHIPFYVCFVLQPQGVFKVKSKQSTPRHRECMLAKDTRQVTLTTTTSCVVTPASCPLALCVPT